MVASEKNTDTREFTPTGDLIVEVRSEIGERLIQTGTVTLKGQINSIAISYQRARQLQILTERGAKGIVRVSPELEINLPDILAIELIHKTEAIPGWQGTEVETSEPSAVLATEILKDTKEVFGISDEEPASVEDGIRKSYANGNASSLWGEALRLNKAILMERNAKKGMWYVVDGKLVLRQARVAEGGGLSWLD